MAQAQRISLLSHLEETAEKLGIQLEYAEPAKPREKNLDFFIPLRSGSYLLKGKRHLLLEKNLSDEAKARMIANAIKACDLDSVFLPPLVREFLQLDE